MEWSDVIKLVELLLTVIVAAGGTVGIVNLVKRFTGVEDNVARVVSWVVTAVTALLAAVAAGQITPELFVNPVDAIVVIVTILLGVAKGSEGLYRLTKS